MIKSIQRLRGRATNSDSGFTLIELLIVILILGILAAIVVVAVGNQQSTAKQSQLRNSGTVPRTTANETLEILNKKLNKTLSIGYADNNGGVSHRIIDAQQIANGVLLARDHSTGELQTFKIIRITGVAPL